MTVREYAEIWLDRHPRGQSDTDHHYACMVKRFVEDFGDRDVDEIGRIEARAWALENRGRARYVRSMLNDALDDELIERNVFAALRLPTAKGRAPITVPTLAEIDRLVQAAQPEFGPAIRFAAYTGVRLGELLALTFNDLAGTTATIDKQITKSGESRRPKSGHSRVIVVPADITPDDLPVCWDFYARIFDWSRRTHETLWRMTLTHADLKFRWHDLRHFAATRFLDGGATEWDVALQLGHQDGGELIRKTYGHPDEEKVRARLLAATTPQDAAQEVSHAGRHGA